MSDELTSQLKELARQGETPPPVPGAQIRLRAGRRRRRRRTAGALAGACAATAFALVLTLNPGGDGDGPHRRTPPATSPTGAPTTPAAPDATVDLSGRALTVNGRTLPISSGYVKTPTPTGRMTIREKDSVTTMPADQAGIADKTYDIKLPWVMKLVSANGAYRTYIAGLTYDEKAPGHYDRTRGWIGLRPSDAKWLYEQLDLGAVVDIEGIAPAATPSAS